MKASNFNLPDQNNKFHKLSDYKGQWVIVYFYPKDDTSGCTKEACGFRNSENKLKEKGIVVIGISKDSVKSHANFSEKYNLNFPILSDESKEVIKTYGAWGRKKFMGRDFEGTLRNTYLINPLGEIVKIYEKVDPAVHAEEILKDINSLNL